jgi:hypothetical protein
VTIKEDTSVKQEAVAIPRVTIECLDRVLLNGKILLRFLIDNTL